MNEFTKNISRILLGEKKPLYKRHKEYNRRHQQVKRHTTCFDVPLVSQSRPTLCSPMDYISPGYSVHGIFQARLLEWVVISLLQRMFPTRDWIHVSFASYIASGFFAHRAAREARMLIGRFKIINITIFPHLHFKFRSSKNIMFFPVTR